MMRCLWSLRFFKEIPTDFHTQSLVCNNIAQHCYDTVILLLEGFYLPV